MASSSPAPPRLDAELFRDLDLATSVSGSTCNSALSPLNQGAHSDHRPDFAFLRTLPDANDKKGTLVPSKFIVFVILFEM